MQKNKKARSEQGITLIALIITIIVVLILVAVSVRTVANSGLFDHAKDATSKWADEQEKEANIGDEVGNVIDKYVGQHDWKRNGDNLNCDHCGLSFVIGDFVDYQPDPTSKTITISDEESGASEVSTTPASLTNNNAQVERMKNENNSSKLVRTSQITGLNSKNKFTQDAETYWQVLGVEDSDGNGTNETLLIKMAFGTSNKLYLGGAAAHNNGPDIMNRIAKELYSSSKYGEARSINITDVNNTLQYTPGGGSYYDSGGKELNGFNTQMKDLPVWNEVKSRGTYTPDGTNTEAKLGSYKVDGYFYTLGTEVVSSLDTTDSTNKIARMSLTNGNQAPITRTALEEFPTYVTNPSTGVKTNVTENTRNIVFLYPDTGSTCSYWLACHSVRVYVNYPYSVYYAFFGPGAVFDGTVDSCYGSFFSGGDVHSYGYPVCPVVPIKSEIPSKIPTPSFEL